MKLSSMLFYQNQGRSRSTINNTDFLFCIIKRYVQTLTGGAAIISHYLNCFIYLISLICIFYLSIVQFGEENRMTQTSHIKKPAKQKQNKNICLFWCHFKTWLKIKTNQIYFLCQITRTIIKRCSIKGSFFLDQIITLF